LVVDRERLFEELSGKLRLTLASLLL
jgi:hypothetical protein